MKEINNKNENENENINEIKNKSENKSKKEEIKYNYTPEECGCNIEALYEGLSFFPKEELLKMVAQGKIEATCDNCGTEYSITGDLLEEVRKMAEEKEGTDSIECGSCLLSCPLAGFNEE